MADARDALRRYLEQRLELGERSIVLETMRGGDLMAVKSPQRGPRATADGGTGAPLRIGDWRSALQASGAEPPPEPSDRRQSPAIRVKAAAPATKTPGAAVPGATEDETGRPFIGAAGKLLTQILEAIKLKREDVFICNVLKHRPPGNRNPTPEEVTACSPFLIRQIELIRPKVILALGTFSAQTLLNTKTSIGKLRGQVHEYHGVPVVVTYHPAALLRNPAWKRPTWEDVQLARRILDSAVPGA